ncbi:UvrB/UvrC motif-containing protein [Bacillus sp. Cs-700]|uniref:UvrB/UvrC motif-containing protein n=1 Tax=Bacillus sp. Cs-700 TaxID=2589818 RepID=UPI00140D884E|nr:UvrB/UvrC motif-containing protein [Bacillus sp. Cs-700]
MTCQECGERPATLHFTKIINGEKTETHICEKCAKEKGEVEPGTNHFSIHNLLSGLLNFETPIGESQAQSFYKPEPSHCPKCGLTYQQFTKIGRFGCSDCYNTFSDKLDPILKKVHGGNTIHSGKIPKRAGAAIEMERKVQNLRNKMKEYIEHEEFEKAAETRDLIRSLEDKSSSEGGE